MAYGPSHTKVKYKMQNIVKAGQNYNNSNIITKNIKEGTMKKN